MNEQEAEGTIGAKALVELDWSGYLDKEQVNYMQARANYKLIKFLGMFEKEEKCSNGTELNKKSF
jgi:hypothetical protein